MNLRTYLNASQRPGCNSPHTLETLEPRLLLSASSPFELAALLPENGGDGSLGFVVSGSNNVRAVSNAGDINGDGFDDLIVGLSTRDHSESGQAKLVFGKPGGFGMGPDLANLNGRNGFTVTGNSYLNHLGHSVSSAGDINGDGFDDLLIGAIGGYHYSYQLGNVYGSTGKAYVIFGKAEPYKADINLRNINGKNRFQFIPNGRYSYITDVSSAGDINGDGFDDVVFAGNSKGYVVFGKAGGFDATLRDESLKGADGFIVTGVGGAVIGGGDINGDGFDDLMFSGGQGSVVIFGKPTGFADTLNADNLDGTEGFKLDVGLDAHIQTASLTGDVNGDGLDDLLIGASRSYTRSDDGRIFRGATSEGYVVFGRTNGFASELDLTTLDGTHGFTITGLDSGGDGGVYASGTGDINNDGFKDFIFSAPNADVKGVRDAGQAHVVFGTSDGFGSSIDVSSPNGTDGFLVLGTNTYDRAGSTVSGLGDINHDGFDDFTVKVRDKTLVIYGGAFIDDGVTNGTDGPDILIGTPGKDFFVGGLGNDELIGNGGPDALFGDAGDDTFTVSDTGFLRVSGGDGTDTLRLDAAGDYLAMTGSLFDRVTGIEIIDMAGPEANTLILDEESFLRVTGYQSTLTVLGNTGDSVYLNTDWRFIGNEVIGTDTFDIYGNNFRKLKLHQSIEVLPTAPPAVDGDFTGDGKADIVWHHTRDGSNAVWQMDGTAFELERKLRRLPNTDWKLVGTGDFTGDGKNDLLWRNTRDGRNRLWEMDRTEFVQRIDLKSQHSLEWQAAGVGDFTGDGRDDILWRNTRNGRNVVWNMFGTVFLESISLKTLANQNWQAAAVGDLTGDGHDDILWRNKTSGRNSFWQLERTELKYTAKVKRIKNPAWQIAGIADYTGGGGNDILWRHTTKGLNSVWEMRHARFADGIPLDPLLDLNQQPAGPLLGLWER